jgi:hypothetical protein
MSTSKRVYTVDEFEEAVMSFDKEIVYGDKESKAALFIVREQNDGGILAFKVATGEDVYQLIDSAPSIALEFPDWDMLTIATCGWAAPVENEDDDFRPSESPNRRRVVLKCYLSNMGLIGSSIAFSDDEEYKPTFDFGKASGPLADMLAKVSTKIINN